MRMTSFPLIRDRSVLFSRQQVLTRPCPVPTAPGVYAWYFAELPPEVDATHCYRADGLTLMYVGISPKPPPTNVRSPPNSTLRQRLRTHFRGNAAGSTLRKSLGCLLAIRLGIQLRRVGSGERLTFTNPGEQVLDDWMQENALVVWHEVENPWMVERQILGSGLSLPLNIRDNPREQQVSILKAARERAMVQARHLPVIPDSGGARRRSPP